MTGVIATIPRMQFSDALGIPLSGGLLYTYLAGTTTPISTYQDQALTTSNENPITLDAAGSCAIWLDSTKNYKFLLKNKNDVTQPGWPVDSISGAGALSQTLQAALSGSNGGSLVGFTQLGVGAKVTNLQDKLRESVSVADYRAVTDPDDSLSFQRAIDALPSTGGRILVPAKIYSLGTTPSWGTKSIHWDFSPAATFTGTGTGQNKFPAMVTNGGQIAAGPFIQSQSRIPYDLNNGGVAAYQIEMLQPADVVGQSVALYLGAQGSNPDPKANVWAGNFLIRVLPGAGGTYQGIELDVDCMSDAALVKGLSINGIGSANPDVGVELIRSDTTMWKTGIDIMNAITGVRIRNTAGLKMGMTLGEPTAQVSAGIVNKQLTNGGDSIVLQRFTDTGSTGSALRVVDAANSVNVANLDVLGNLTLAGSLSSQNLKVTGGGSIMPAGQLCLSSSTATTATAGGAALPAAPALFLSVFYGPTLYKIPLYLN